jgi:hypothetical protein
MDSLLALDDTELTLKIKKYIFEILGTYMTSTNNFRDMW